MTRGQEEPTEVPRTTVISISEFMKKRKAIENAALDKAIIARARHLLPKRFP